MRDAFLFFGAATEGTVLATDKNLGDLMFHDIIFEI